jgi:radical SAM superfamily enzyme YgiQ (UPF0313 family)
MTRCFAPPLDFSKAFLRFPIKVKKLILINPVNKARPGLRGKKSSKVPPLGLGIVAALTPDDWDVKIIDEHFTEPTAEEADLVGITACTASANRAYEVAKIYRDKNIPVVMGGIHASLLPREASKYVDCVVVGEAEGVWPRVIADFESGNLKKIYKSEKIDLYYMPIPRHDLFHKGYMFGAIQTARGCPMDCEFCSVTSFNGHTYRQRPVENVLDEIEKIPQDLFFFVDDNIIGYSKSNSKRALDLFQGMIRRGIKKDWFCQASLNFADDEEVLKYAAKSGCRMVVLGLEAENIESLKEANKNLNLKMGVNSYENTFKKIHKYGIAVIGAFIYGFDSDTPEILDKRMNYIIDSGVDAVQTTFLTPLPGTRLFDKMQKEGRLLYTNFPSDWDYFDGNEVVFKSKLMSRKELTLSMYKCDVKIGKSILKKFYKTLFATKSIITSFWALITNINYQNVRRKKKSNK